VEIWQDSIQSHHPNPLDLARDLDIAYNEFGELSIHMRQLCDDFSGWVRETEREFSSRNPRAPGAFPLCVGC
jgi:hypothetical protein